MAPAMLPFWPPMASARAIPVHAWWCALLVGGALVGACSLNPQPLPPSTEGAGGTPGAEDSGTPYQIQSDGGGGSSDGGGKGDSSMAGNPEGGLVGPDSGAQDAGQDTGLGPGIDGGSGEDAADAADGADAEDASDASPDADDASPETGSE